MALLQKGPLLEQREKHRIRIDREDVKEVRFDRGAGRIYRVLRAGVGVQVGVDALVLQADEGVFERIGF